MRLTPLIGAIVGDIAGSRFEWLNCKSKDFTFMVGQHEGAEPCSFTDDTVMTLAIADAIMKWRGGSDNSYGSLSGCAIKSMQAFGRRYPNAGYGGSFMAWLQDKNPRPYNSWGNGAAMRVSACGWAGWTLDEVKAMSRAVTEVTHNHPEGIRGAEATAVATFLAHSGKTMAEIRKVVARDYYRLNFSLDEIRESYKFDVSCQGSVPQALEAFFESTSFEDAIRNAISIGGDSDTIGAICGAVAGAYYGVPSDIRAKTETFLPPDLLETLHAFDSTIGAR
jgi:type I restriction enzyme M protein